MAADGANLNLDALPLIRDLVLLAIVQGVANLVLLGLILGNRKTRNELLTHVGELVKTVTVGKLAHNRGAAEAVTAIKALAGRSQVPPPGDPNIPDQPTEEEVSPVGMKLTGGF